MDGKMDLFTLIALIAAVVAMLKLWSVLGRDTGGAERRADRANAERRRTQAAEEAGKVIAMPRREAAPEVAAAGNVVVAEGEQRIMSFALAEPGAKAGLLAIAKADPAFEPQGFLEGSKRAYEMIVTAFAEGNRKTLKDLLSREVFDGFLAEMVARDKRGDVIDQSFVGINRADITEAELKGGVATITVRFVSQLISAVRDRSGAVIGGDPQKIKEVTDVWTFNRDIGSARARASLNWKLIATQES
jgi:predicted lipid-binding transport protein (Tim44 family)